MSPTVAIDRPAIGAFTQGDATTAGIPAIVPMGRQCYTAIKSVLVQRTLSTQANRRYLKQAPPQCWDFFWPTPPGTKYEPHTASRWRRLE